jgi:hypothetical protein
MSLDPTEWWNSFRAKRNQLHPESSGNDFMPKAPSKYLTPGDKGIGKSANLLAKNNNLRANNNMNHLSGNPGMGFDSRSPLKL